MTNASPTGASGALIYVLPEVKTVQQVFGVDHFTIAQGSVHQD